MNKPNILIAEKDFATRLYLVRCAAESGYPVATMNSVAPLLCNLMRNRLPVVLLDDSFEGTIQIVDLIYLIKRSNPQTTIILISDDISLLQMRKARELGLFYHALKPVAPQDWQELTKAMECAVQSALTTTPRRSSTPSLYRTQ